MSYKLMLGDCEASMALLPSGSIDLIYLDPPFFTQKTHSLAPRSRDAEFKFDDIWPSRDAYSDFLVARLRHAHRLLNDTGSLFFHCDSRASHVARTILDSIFGYDQFRSEIIWHYRRWSNSQRGLLPAHQTILFYSKTSKFTFNETFVEYSASTNIDQILQKRGRDHSNKVVYSRDDDGETITSGVKRGVPLGDVWDIPFLNPKASERVGYPTQKPVLLLERIVQLVTNPGATVLDPFCGSGTTLVAAQLLQRDSIGIDISPDAIAIAEARMLAPRKTESRLLQVGRDAYATADQEALEYLKGAAILPVQRNAGIDAIITEDGLSGPVLIRVQRPNESRLEAAQSLLTAARGKKASALIVVATGPARQAGFGFHEAAPSEVTFVDSVAESVRRLVSDLKGKQSAVFPDSVDMGEATTVSRRRLTR